MAAQLNAPRTPEGLSFRGAAGRSPRTVPGDGEGQRVRVPDASLGRQGRWGGEWRGIVGAPPAPALSGHVLLGGRTLCSAWLRAWAGCLVSAVRGGLLTPHLAGPLHFQSIPHGVAARGGVEIQGTNPGFCDPSHPHPSSQILPWLPYCLPNDIQTLRVARSALHNRPKQNKL